MSENVETTTEEMEMKMKEGSHPVGAEGSTEPVSGVDTAQGKGGMDIFFVFKSLNYLILNTSNTRNFVALYTVLSQINTYSRVMMINARSRVKIYLMNLYIL